MLLNSLGVAIFFVIVFACGENSASKCKFGTEVDITQGVRDDHVITYDNISYSKENYYTEKGKIFGCPCNVKLCVRKCCKLDESFLLGTCNKTNEEKLVMNVYDKTEKLGIADIYYLDNFLQTKCDGNLYFNSYNSSTDVDKFLLQEDGSLYFPNPKIFVDSKSFCLEYHRYFSFTERELIAYICSEELSDNGMYTTVTGLIISIPLLVVTLIVYALLPERNLPNKVLMCYVFSLLVAYIFLVTLNTNFNMDIRECILIAFLCYFFFMASFFWMNVICLDMFLTFSGISVVLGVKGEENRRFVYYNTYVWSSSLILVCYALAFTFGKITKSGSVFYTGIGNDMCWFNGEWARAIYFYFPVGILLVVNCVLFAMTTYKIKKVQRITKILNNKTSQKHTNKQQYYLYIKLLFAMGMNWCMEIISWAFLWKYPHAFQSVWMVTDFCNASYGIFIFFLFVFKKRIWTSLKERYLKPTRRPPRTSTVDMQTTT